MRKTINKKNTSDTFKKIEAAKKMLMFKYQTDDYTQVEK